MYGMKRTPGHDGAYVNPHVTYKRNFTDEDDLLHYDAVMEGLAEDGHILTKQYRRAIRDALAEPSNLAALHRLAVVVSEAKTLMDSAPADKKERCHVTIHGVDLQYIHSALTYALDAATRRAEANEREEDAGP